MLIVEVARGQVGSSGTVGCEEAGTMGAVGCRRLDQRNWPGHGKPWRSSPRAAWAIRWTQQRAVLAMLAARAGRMVITAELVDGIWGDDPQKPCCRRSAVTSPRCEPPSNRLSKDTDPDMCSEWTAPRSTPVSLRIHWKPVVGSRLATPQPSPRDCAGRSHFGVAVPTPMSPTFPGWNSRLAVSAICV